MEVPVLVVDAAPERRDALRAALSAAGIVTVEAETGAEALARAGEGGPDVAVIASQVVDSEGARLLAELSERFPRLHVIVLRDHGGGSADRRDGADLPAAPTPAPGLVARIVSARRRTGGTGAFADILELDHDARTVSVRGRAVPLTPKEFDLLAFLVERPRQTFSRDQLLEEVWASSSEWQGAATVTEHVRRLRAKIEVEPEAPELLLTVRGVGYRLDPPPPPGDDAVADGGGTAKGTAVLVVVGDVIRSASAAAASLLGASDADALVGRDGMDFVGAASVTAATSRRASLRSEHWPRPEPMWVRRVDGDEVLVEVATSPVRWEGQPARQVILWEVAADPVQLRQVLTGTSTEVADAVIVTDPGMRIRSFNPAAEELYGWREDEVVGRRVDEVLPLVGAPGAVEESLRRLQEEGHWVGVAQQVRRDGTPVQVRASTTVVRDGSGHPVAVISVNRAVAGAALSLGLPMPGVALDDRLHGEMAQAMAAGEFLVHYQPVVRLATSQPVGMEALVRWRHPVHGLLHPSEFIGAGERSGAIVELGDRVLAAACTQAERWREAGHDLHVSVNVSVRQLTDELPGRVAAMMGATGMPAGRLWLELTETALVSDLDQARAVLSAIDALGARISIDDFGTGWASLTYLREFPVGMLKIDGSFVRGLGARSSDEAIVRSVISLGRELGLKVTAEGIETPAQRDHLLRLGCRYGQGHLFSEAVPAEDIRLEVATGPTGRLRQP